MVRSLILSIVLSFLALPTIAQHCGTRDLIAELAPEQRARLDALVAAHPYSEGTIWRAEKPDSSVLVVGTLHIPDPRFQDVVAQLTPEIEAADLLILEASAEDELAMQALSATEPEMFFLTEGPTLIDILSEDEWNLAKDRLAALGIPGFLAAKFQPWYLSLTLAIPPCAMVAMQAGEKGLDRQLEQVALNAGVELATLDNVKELLKLFADEPLEKQLDGLRLTLESSADGDATTSTLIASYFDGRVREGWEFGRIQIEESGIENGAELFEEVNQELLENRNKDWEPKIAAFVDGKQAVIAVGAAHLSGESGVLRALERAGYTLSPY